MREWGPGDAKEHKVSFWSNENILKLVWWRLHKSVNLLKAM